MADPLFTVRNIFNERTYANFCKTSIKYSTKIFRIIGTFLMALALIYVGIFEISSAITGKGISMSGVICALCLIWGIVSLNHYPLNNYKKIYNSMNMKKNEEFIFEFYENDMAIKSKYEYSYFPYKLLHSIRISKNQYIFLDSIISGFALNKDECPNGFDLFVKELKIQYSI